MTSRPSCACSSTTTSRSAPFCTVPFCTTPFCTGRFCSAPSHRQHRCPVLSSFVLFCPRVPLWTCAGSRYVRVLEAYTAQHVREWRARHSVVQRAVAMARVADSLASTIPDTIPPGLASTAHTHSRACRGVTACGRRRVSGRDAAPSSRDGARLTYPTPYQTA